jgi:hypothetical protein
MIILAAEIPAACAAACEVTGEPWQHRPSAICLRAIPRLHHQLTELGMPAAARDLETRVHHWTRTVKFALGLRTPDIPVGCDEAADCGVAHRGHHDLMPADPAREPALDPAQVPVTFARGWAKVSRVVSSSAVAGGHCTVRI